MTGQVSYAPLQETYGPTIIESAARDRTITDIAYETIVEKILRMELPPGAALQEKNLVQELNIGRTPVREALHRLASEGLVCRKPNRGVFVCEATLQDARDICEFRLAIEGRMARLAASHATAMQAEILRETASLLWRLDPTSEFDEFATIGRHFYSVMAEASGNSHYQQIVPRLYNSGLWFLVFVGRASGDWERLAQDFKMALRDLVEPIAHGRAEQAEALMRLYITTYRDSLINRDQDIWQA